jgi:hypothetical protein
MENNLNLYFAKRIESEIDIFENNCYIICSESEEAARKFLSSYLETNLETTLEKDGKTEYLGLLPKVRMKFEIKYLGSANHSYSKNTLVSSFSTHK